MLLSQRAAWVWTTKPISDLSIYDREAFAFRIDDAGVFENLSPDDQRLILDAEANAGLLDKILIASCSTCGEFACRSKSCAPPPVGTGGSAPVPSGTAEGEGFSASRLTDLITAESQKTLGEFEDWIKKADITDSRRAAACKMRSERAVVDELLSTEEGRAVIDDLLGAMFTGTTTEIINRITGANSSSSWTAPFKEDAMNWYERSKAGEATFGDLIKSVIADANNLDDAYRLRDARRLLTMVGLSATDATPEKLAAHMVSRMFIQNWADDSTSVGGSLQSQIAAKDRHGLEEGSLLRTHVEDAGRWASFNDPLSVRLSRAVLDAEYRATQKFLKETLGPDVKTVVLYRGVKGQYKGTEPDDVVEIESNPLSSWTTHASVANRDEFSGGASGVVLEMHTPIEMIQSTPFTGRGCLGEFEMVVIGHPSTAKRVA